MQRCTIKNVQEIGVYQRSVYEVLLAKSEIEQTEPIVLVLCIQHYVKLRLLELRYYLVGFLAILTSIKKWKCVPIHSF